MGEKKRRLAAQRAGPVRHDGGLIAQAFAALQRGDRQAAASAFDALQTALPTDADALHAVGVLGLQLGESRRSEELLSRAVLQNPRDPTYRCHLAIAFRRLGQPDRAIDELGVALGLNPALAEAHSNLGNILRERGDVEGAVASFARALAIRGDYPDALNGLGEAELALGHLDVACSRFERALAVDPAFHEARYNLARARMEWSARIERAAGAGVPPPAAVENARLGLESILAALQLAPDIPAYWTQFEDCVRNFDLRFPVDPRIHDALLRALDHPAVEPARLVRPIVSLVATHPGVPEIRRLLECPGSFDAPAWMAHRQAVAEVLGDPLLQRVLESTVVASDFVQSLLAASRRALLHDLSDGPGSEPSLPLSAVAAIAHQAFSTEYLYEESAEERAGVSDLRSAIGRARAAGVPVPLHAYATYACYRPLDMLEAADRIADELRPTTLHSLAVRQIEEPREEARLRGTIVALTEIVGEVSAAVQAQYEAHPYPRWQRVRRSAAPSSVARFLRERFPEADLGGIGDAPARILVAGCGTGRHPIITASRFPDSTVLAVDLSLTSLAYAMRKTRSLGIGNIEYRQADILAMGSIAERFDVIECSGVLHHLEDPLAGWRMLCSLLRPEGAMLVGLYSEIARRHVVRAREFVAAGGFVPTPDGIRACRRAILARSDDPLLARLARGEDFYSLSGCRDLVFHVQEQRFTLPRIAAAIEQLGLQFIGFDFPDADAAASYRARFPDDRTLADLARWHEVEAAEPDTFALMYQFWVRKRD